MIRNIKLLTLGLSLLAAGSSFACSEDGTGGFVPDNNLYIPANAKGLKGGITEEQFTAVIDKVENIYAPIVSSLGGKLEIIRNWEDGTVNAYAQQAGSTWKVSMFGGLARHEAITEDGMALVVCHEIGHHIGGAPKKGGAGGWGGAGSSWASNEGQSDYFATLKCLRKVFLSDNNRTIVAGLNAPQPLIASCKKSFSNKIDSDICVRGGMAGYSVANLFRALRSQTTLPDVTTPDPKEVTSTDHNHPATQCRLDTYYQGALCDVDDNTDVSNSNEVTGTCHGANNDSIGLRPRCWFKPSK